MMKFLFFLIFMLNILNSLIHPLALCLLLTMKVFVISFMLFNSIHSWFFFSLMMIFAGGMMIIFMYSSLLSNNDMLKIMIFPVNIVNSSMLILVILFWSMNLNLEGSKLNNSLMFFEMKPLFAIIYKIQSMSILIFTLLYLLMMLFYIVSISENFKGAIMKWF